ncbi:serine protease [Solihabitans fulvus]|uniref:Serine protease n=1 Tax=Solihabitans fulvus TaxID=1892852 RepID=A0A5B2X628_9PSEU|nr:serine protease [Solihabitans fulvus]KAA2258549.1 serine protease [Solihabitans fulvus]
MRSTRRRLAVPAMVLVFAVLAATACHGDPAAVPPASRAQVRSVAPTEGDDAAQRWTGQRTVPLSSAGSPTATGGQPAAVGALFYTDSDGALTHHCTASVLHSPNADVVLTAAHCIHDGYGGDYVPGLVFVPGYRDGASPYGVWVPTRTIVAPGWQQSGDPNLDVGFLVVRQPGSDHRIEDVTGANTLGVDQGFEHRVTVTGYPSESDEPVTCAGESSRQNDSQLSFQCPDYTNGTSGAPWVADADPRTGSGTVVGVIGGYEEGGVDPDVSYSPYFGQDVKSLYDKAVAAS